MNMILLAMALGLKEDLVDDLGEASIVKINISAIRRFPISRKEFKKSVIDVEHRTKRCRHGGR